MDDYSGQLFGDSPFDPRLPEEKPLLTFPDFNYSQDEGCRGPIEDPIYFLGRIADFGDFGTERALYAQLYEVFKPTGLPITVETLTFVRDFQCDVHTILAKSPEAYLDMRLFEEDSGLRDRFYAFFETRVVYTVKARPSNSDLLLFGAHLYVEDKLKKDEKKM